MNDEVLRRVNKDKEIIPATNKRQRPWLCYTLRRGNQLSLIIEGRVKGRRPPGRPEKKNGNARENKKNGDSY